MRSPITALLAFFVLAACNPGEVADDDGSPSSSPSSPSDTSSPSSPGSANANAIDDARYYASFDFQTQKVGGSSAIARNVAAGFFDRTPVDGVGCSKPAKTGACAVIECDAPTSPTAPRYNLLTANDVKASIDTQVVPLTQQAQGLYATDQHLVWTAGTTLGASATGGANGVPAFSVSTTAPSHLTMTAPALVESTFMPLAGTHPKSQGLTVAWSGGGHGNALVKLVGSDPTAKRLVNLSCEAPSVAGSLTVPAAELARFAKRVQLGLDGQSSTIVRRADWAIAVVARDRAEIASGREAVAFIDLL